jgi:uncharacterized protein YdeI (YjbR/CyaY-like superfamily)
MKTIKSGVAHNLPNDLKKLIKNDKSVFERWDDLTPLARNEWICWVISTKKEETRNKHLQRLETDLLAGKRRPCCWGGCPHRK